MDIRQARTEVQRYKLLMFQCPAPLAAIFLLSDVLFSKS